MYICILLFLLKRYKKDYFCSPDNEIKLKTHIMKNLISTLFALVIGISLTFAQQIDRTKVVVEIATGTW